MALGTNSSYCTYFFHANETTEALTAAFPGDPILFINQILDQPPINFITEGLMIANDSAASIFISLNGTDNHGEIKVGETLLFDKAKLKQVWVRGTAGGEAYRLWAW